MRAAPTASLFCWSVSPLMAGLKKNTRRMAKRIISLSRMSHTSGFPQVIFRKPSRYRDTKKENMPEGVGIEAASFYKISESRRKKQHFYIRQKMTIFAD